MILPYIPDKIKVTYPWIGHRLCKKSKVLIVEPHLSEFEFKGHKVTAGKDTS